MHTMTFHPRDLFRALGQCKLATPITQNNRTFRVVSALAAGSHLHLVGTDSYRIHYARVDLIEAVDQPLRFVIPVEAIDGLKTIGWAAKTAVPTVGTITVTDADLVFASPGTSELRHPRPDADDDSYRTVDTLMKIYTSVVDQCHNATTPGAAVNINPRYLADLHKASRLAGTAADQLFIETVDTHARTTNATSPKHLARLANSPTFRALIMGVTYDNTIPAQDHQEVITTLTDDLNTTTAAAA